MKYRIQVQYKDKVFRSAIVELDSKQRDAAIEALETASSPRATYFTLDSDNGIYFFPSGVLQQSILSLMPEPKEGT